MSGSRTVSDETVACFNFTSDLLVLCISIPDTGLDKSDNKD